MNSSSSSSSSSSPEDEVQVTRKVQMVLGWPSDTFSIHVIARGDKQSTPVPSRNTSRKMSCSLRAVPKTLLVFVPGNPGLVEWYITIFENIIKRLGRGFAAVGVSNAGHSCRLDSIRPLSQAGQQSQQADPAVAWTMDGQVLHKCAYLDMILEEYRDMNEQSTLNNHENDRDRALDGSQHLPRLVFCSHSIGAHFTQRLLIIRPDLLQRTSLLIHLTPFLRMKAPLLQQSILDWAARHPDRMITFHARIMSVLAVMPYGLVKAFLRGKMSNERACEVATNLVRQPDFGRNFVALGTEEIREVPEIFDVSAMRFIGRSCPTTLLFAGGDRWAPEFYMDDLQQLQQRRVLPGNISVHYDPTLQHDFIANSEQAALVSHLVEEWIRRSILEQTEIKGKVVMTSRL